MSEVTQQGNVKMKIALTHEQEDRVVRKSLQKAIKDLVQQRNRVMLSQKGLVFSIDAKEDILMITRLIDAMIFTHNYYSNEEEKIDQPDVD